MVYGRFEGAAGAQDHEASDVQEMAVLKEPA
jgi:hypothetical protein